MRQPAGRSGPELPESQFLETIEKLWESLGSDYHIRILVRGECVGEMVKRGRDNTNTFRIAISIVTLQYSPEQVA